MSLSIYSNINNGQVDCCVLGLCGAGSRQYSPHSCRWDGTKEVYWMIHCQWKRKKRSFVGSDNSNSSFLFQHSVAGLIQSVLKWQGWLKTNDWWETFSFNSFPHSADSSGLPVLLGALRVDQPDLEDPAEDQLDPPWPGHQVPLGPATRKLSLEMTNMICSQAPEDLPPPKWIYHHLLESKVKITVDKGC